MTGASFTGLTVTINVDDILASSSNSVTVTVTEDVPK